MAPHLFCHKTPLRTGIKTLARIYLAVSTSFFVCGVILVSFEEKPIPLKNTETRTSDVITHKCVGHPAISAGAIGMIVSLLLLHGEATNSIWKLRVFQGLQIIYGGVSIIDIYRNPLSIVSNVIGFIVVAKFVWVVELFIREVQLELKSQNAGCTVK